MNVHDSDECASYRHFTKICHPIVSTGCRLYYYLGMKAYDLLAGPLGFEASRLLSTVSTISALPTIQSQGLRGGVAYADGQFDDVRLAIALAQTAVDQGAVLLNYAPSYVCSDAMVVWPGLWCAMSNRRVSLRCRVRGS